ncbi:hemerythrin hhe cation binding domain-containing protein [Ophiostoma piceae UAMH 11346]|uniref:Hemerythrin hhe cation binding domain-containing protein n=1 Tax=Ophiostoma piceae (strain UAMH 11346) TaxID=1262450 RepID=S3C9Z7_OPHP1|nr:hemerythrin hhe cation binding domain-containing protein [Ophiostoma piceae UAMH 11346]
MAPVYADHPFPLIPAPYQLPRPGDKASAIESAAGEMACVHNCLIRAINAIYLQAPYIKEADTVAFSEYSYLFYDMLNLHHQHEEKSFFPGIEKLAGAPGIMAANVDQHHAFHDGLEEFGKYTRACADGTEKYDSARLLGIIDSFAAVLTQHLTDEITTLLELKKYDKGSFCAEYKKLSDAAGKGAIEAAGFTTGLVFIVFCCDKSYEGGRWKTFPPAPAPIMFVVRYIASMVNSSWWKFSPTNQAFQLRPLVTAADSLTAKPMPREHQEPNPDLRRVLRDRQRARNRISCLPCRERKVKCSREHPCATCIKRDHPDLCIYSAPPLPTPPPVPSTGPVSEAGSGIGHEARTSATARPEDQGYGDLHDRRHANSGLNVSDPSSLTPQASPSGIPLLGGSALLAIAREHSSHTYHVTDGGGDDVDGGRSDALENAVIPLLGVAHSDHGRRTSKSQSDDLYINLPGDQDLFSLFSVYRTRVHPYQLVLGDMDDVERELCDIVNQRASILYANDYLLCPFQEGLCALLILAHVLQNDGNPQASWIMSGSTIRMAVALGIPATSYGPRFGPSLVSPERARQLRLSIMLQDALLSLAFNRPPESREMDSEEDLPPLSNTGLSYGQAMGWLSHLTLKYWPYVAVWNQSPDAAMGRFTSFFADMDRLEGALQEHLRGPEACHSIQAIHEFYRMELHINFIVSTFCRPVLSKRAQQKLDSQQSGLVLERLQRSLKRSVKAFIRLRSVTGHASRSWAFVHNGLTSALLLSFIKETRNEDESRQIQDELIKSLTEGDGVLGPDQGTQLTMAHRKSLKALRSLRRISEEEERNRQANQSDRPMVASADGTGGSPIAFPPMIAAAEGGNDATALYADPESADFDVLLRSLDFNSASLLPMEAFDYITFDLMAPTANFGGNFGGF